MPVRKVRKFDVNRNKCRSTSPCVVKFSVALRNLPLISDSQMFWVRHVSTNIRCALGLKKVNRYIVGERPNVEFFPSDVVDSSSQSSIVRGLSMVRRLFLNRKMAHVAAILSFFLI